MKHVFVSHQVFQNTDGCFTVRFAKVVLWHTIKKCLLQGRTGGGAGGRSITLVKEISGGRRPEEYNAGATDNLKAS